MGSKGKKLNQSTLEDFGRQRIFKSEILAGYFYKKTSEIKTFTLRFTSKPVKQMRSFITILT